MTCTEPALQTLRARGFRMTPQRLCVLKILHNAPEHLTPQQVYEQAARAMPGLTETTIYRALEFLAAHHLVNAALTASGKLTYELARRAHHHLVCRACGAQMEIDHELLLPVYRSLEETSGFQINTSHLTFFGLCPHCKETE